MKNLFKVFVLSGALLFSGVAFADGFDWSECWCNYGGGIEKFDVILDINVSADFNDSYVFQFQNPWVIPPVFVDVQVAVPIWKLPFTFGGYFGFKGYGYKYQTYSVEEGWHYRDSTYWGIFFGGEIAYHVMLPPKGLDVYIKTRIGGNVPFATPGNYIPYYFHWGESIGATWYFNDVFGVNVEIGYPFTKLGCSLKF